MQSSPDNVHGRRPGRGFRPWLLIPKVLASSVYFGALIAASAVWLTRGDVLPVEAFSFLFRFVIVPALLAAIALGAALTLLHWPHLAKMRWWQVKIASLAVMVPAGHLYLSSRLESVRHATSDESIAAIARQIDVALICVAVASAWVIFLGRHKPQLGQNWAKTYRAALVLAVLTLGSAGCQWWFVHPDAPIKDPLRPADFSLSFHVDGDGLDAEPLVRSSMFVLESDRRLYAAIGFQAPNGFRPRLTRVVTQEEYDRIVQYVLATHLLAEPTSPTAASMAGTDTRPVVLYHVDLMGWRQINRYVTTPQESPPSVELLALLISAAGLDPGVTVEPLEGGR